MGNALMLPLSLSFALLHCKSLSVFYISCQISRAGNKQVWDKVWWNSRLLGIGYLNINLYYTLLLYTMSLSPKIEVSYWIWELV